MGVEVYVGKEENYKDRIAAISRKKGLCGGLNLKNLNLERYGGFFDRYSFSLKRKELIFFKNYPSSH